MSDTTITPEELRAKRDRRCASCLRAPSEVGALRRVVRGHDGWRGHLCGPCFFHERVTLTRAIDAWIAERKAEIDAGAASRVHNTLVVRARHRAARLAVAS